MLREAFLNQIQSLPYLGVWGFVVSEGIVHMRVMSICGKRVKGPIVVVYGNDGSVLWISLGCQTGQFYGFWEEVYVVELS